MVVFVSEIVLPLLSSLYPEGTNIFPVWAEGTCQEAPSGAMMVAKGVPGAIVKPVPSREALSKAEI